MARDRMKAKKTRGIEAEGHVVDNEPFSLETVTELGGNKADLDLLKDLDSEVDEIEDFDTPADDLEADPIKKDEIREFLSQLGIWKYRPDKEKDLLKTQDKFLKAPQKDTGSNNAGTPAPRSVPVTSAKTAGLARKEKNKLKVQHAEVSSTSSGVEELIQHFKKRTQHSHLMIKPGDIWRDDQANAEVENVSPELLQKAETFAKYLHNSEVALYSKQREKAKRSDSRWMKTVLTSGTLSDKMAALMLLIQESPIHNIASVDTLVAMAKKKGKREAMLATDTLKELFLSTLLPDNRKLVHFEDRPLAAVWQANSGNRDAVDKQLLMWYIESLLKDKYSDFIKALDVMSYDTILATKQKALDTMHSLMSSKPEQENVLLPMIVNKLGDPDYKLASRTSYLLLKLVNNHPNMKAVIAKEVEHLVYRPGISQRAQYYAMCFLNQIKLHKSDQALALRLITIYFTFFKVYVKKGEVDSKMMAALLTGVNRAYPFAKLEKDFLNEQMNTLYKIVHIVNFNTSVQALMLLQQVTDASTNESNRYYMALYRKMVDPSLKTSAKQAQFLNLLFKSMKCDLCDNRVKAFMKRLLQVSSQIGPNVLCGALIILSELVKDRPSLLSTKQMGHGITTSGSHQEKDIPNKNTLVCDGDDEEEHFVDLPVPPEFKSPIKETDILRDGADNLDGNIQKPKPHGSKMHISSSSWVHVHNLSGKPQHQDYDPYGRNPLYCRAQHECLWELHSLMLHYHPSVSLFARTLLQGQPISYSGDPLQDFTLIRFLDRFVYKNPKKIDSEDADTGVLKKVKSKPMISSIPVNSSHFLEAGEEAVPEHERYLYRYFSQRAERKKVESGDASDEDSEAESISDSEFDSFLDKFERQVDHDDLGDFGHDFASNMISNKKKKAITTDKDDVERDNLSISDDDFDDGLSDEEPDLDSDDDLAAEFRQEMKDLEDDEDEGEFSDDELKQMMSSKRKRRKEHGDSFIDEKKAKRNRGDSVRGLFAAAEEFADLLEENVGINLGTTEAVSNKDKAGPKQLAWEAERDRHISGHKTSYDKKHRKARKGRPFHGRLTGNKGNKKQKPGKGVKHGKRRI